MPFSISGIEISYSEGAFFIPDKEISNANMPFSISGKEISYSEGAFSILNMKISNMNMPFSISGMEVSPSEGAFCISDIEISIFEELFLKKMTLPRRPRRSRRRNSPKDADWQWMNADSQRTLIRSIRRLLNKRLIILLILV